MEAPESGLQEAEGQRPPEEGYLAIAKDVRTLGVYHRRSTDFRKRWEDLHCWSKKMAEAQLGMATNVEGVPVAP
ncbi:hypothetical protein NDU88_006395 [Pleurodeles waltl]|uniref:Uncharacterized protein n=1 Tax=Pleurodeles waltl TaxID=8319 RepID=A0AAV7SPD1_PLEWA|nr:hypothetical protein NDU88_006395 [Pleurodeles waltl]